jgi:hypothetical protein
MNRINFNEVGGFPMDVNILSRLQDSIALFNAVGSIVGDKTIISGCNAIGSSVSNGVVYINSEVFEFRGGLAQSKVIIVEETTALKFGDNKLKPVIKTRYVTFGTGIDAMDWGDFKRGFETKEITPALEDIVARLNKLEAAPPIPKGMIAIWDRPANEIPSGWEEHLPLSGKVPIGFDENDGDFDVVGKSDGSKRKTLGEKELPVISPINGIYMGKGNTAPGIAGLTVANGLVGDFGPGELIKPFGGGQSFSIMNPYRVVHFIKYIGNGK